MKEDPQKTKTAFLAKGANFSPDRENKTK